MKRFRQILSIFFSALVFISSSSYSIGMHRCGGEVRDVAFLSQADACGHQQLPPCHRKLMSGCCSDETLSYNGQGFDVNQTVNFITSAGGFIQPLILIDEVVSKAVSSSTSFTY